jgi:hypothetical protein
MIIASDDSSSPSGLILDSDDYSCAYDALLTISYEIWLTDTKAWTRQFKDINQCHLKSLSACFKNICMVMPASKLSETLSDMNFTLCQGYVPEDGRITI